MLRAVGHQNVHTQEGESDKSQLADGADEPGGEEQEALTPYDYISSSIFSLNQHTDLKTWQTFAWFDKNLKQHEPD